jgi:hypothetical protein
MKFLIQKINNEIRHDFAFTLLESIRFNKWLRGKDSTMKVRYLNTINKKVEDEDDILPFRFVPYHKDYVPIGSVDFVTRHLWDFYQIIPKPLNVPEALFEFAGRKIFNGTEKDLKGRMFVKSNDKIKGTCDIWNESEGGLPSGNYQFSETISIDSEWRAFVYENKLVGLQNYAGDFTIFPNVNRIKEMIGR